MRWFFALAGLFVSAVASAALSTAEFSPRSLVSWDVSIRGSSLFPKSDHESAFDPELTPLSSSVQFTGDARPVSASKLAFLKKLDRVVLQKGKVASVYRREILVRENGFPFWLVVQNAHIPYLARELNPGEDFRIYYRFAGVARQKQPVYLLVEFDSRAAKNGTETKSSPEN